MKIPRDPSEGADEGFLEGKLLIAMPGMPDDRFAQTVIYVCAHSASGTMGLVINRPVPGLTFSHLMSQMDIETRPDLADFPVLHGGPVETGRGFVLHSNDYKGTESTIAVSDDISLTATIDVLRALAEGRGPSRALLALGYAGWDAGQVEDEFQGNGWLHCDADPAIVFAESRGKWVTALKRLGIGPSGLVSETGRA